jgi:hypothetical protein
MYQAHFPGTPKMTRGPADYLVRWDLNEIGTLDEVAFQAAVPKMVSNTSTITFWFLITNLSGKKVLANMGNKSASQEGWSVFFFDGQLVFRANFDGRQSQEASFSLLADSSWHHFAGVIDRKSQVITGYLDGSTTASLDSNSTEQIELDAIQDSQLLVIGGYTDAAGGHFDHTFGRQGTGLVNDFRIYSRSLQPKEIRSFLKQVKKRPVARFEFNQPREGLQTTVHFDASVSYDQAGHNPFFYWNFGDGQFGSGPVVSHTYAYDGTYQVRLLIVNDNHEQDAIKRTIHLHGGDSPLDFIPVFTNGSEGFACYRIPSIVRTANGDLVAFAEGRLKECSDATPVIRLVCKRSSDNGLTWGPVQVMSRNIVNDKEYGCMNPSPVVDTVHGTGRIVVVFNKKEYSEWEIAKGKGINRTFCIFSDDHGRTWHGEKDITLQVHKPYNPSYRAVYADAARPENKKAGWRKQVPLPGHAIQLLGTVDNPITRGRIFYEAGKLVILLLSALMVAALRDSTKP